MNQRLIIKGRDAQIKVIQHFVKYRELKNTVFR